jgi:hypothetical protein
VDNTGHLRRQVAWEAARPGEAAHQLGEACTVTGQCRM